MLTPERLAELRHVAEQAASLPHGPWGHRYLSEFIPGVVLELLDMADRVDELADELGARIERHRTEHVLGDPRDRGYRAGLSDAEDLLRGRP